MRSNVLKIEHGTADLAAILNESEKVAVYNGLDHKQTMQLRLLCEELDNMIPELIGDFEGNFYIDFQDGVCKINASIIIGKLDTEGRHGLIDIASNHKNAAAKGLGGKIRSAVEGLLAGVDLDAAFDSSMVGLDGMPTVGLEDIYYRFWKLSQDKPVTADAEAWDELEKSVIATVADDVIVGIKGKSADIVIVKKFG